MPRYAAQLEAGGVLSSLRDAGGWNVGAGMSTRTHQSVWRRNLSRRLKAPALGNGRIQKAARNALWALGTASTSQIIEFAYARRLLMLGERRKNDLNRAARRALLAIEENSPRGSAEDRRRARSKAGGISSL
jgi:hypothetical protein